VGDTSGATHFVTITVVPELDVVLLGGFGVIMLLRRRR
jgi:nitrate reductase NapE component